MILNFEDRLSDSPLIERVWRSYSEAGGPFLSVAMASLELVVIRLPDLTLAILRGPETRATLAECPPNGRWTGIRFAPGVYFPRVPTVRLLDHNNLDLPVSHADRFWFDDAAWELPTYENAETFVSRLVRHGAIARDAAVACALAGDRDALTARSVQRHFRHATGMTHGLFRQIERARHAADLLRCGRPILDAAHEAGYFDQAHLGRSLKALIGLTPARLLRQESQLSLLYKTAPASAS